MKIFILSSDRYPPFRVDVKDLFGVELCKKNYQFDWVLQSEEKIPSQTVEELYCGRVWVVRTNNRSKWHQRLHKYLLGFIGDLRLLQMDLSGYDAVQVKDKLLAALIAIVAVSNDNTKFKYCLSYPFSEASLYKVKIGVARYPLFYRLWGHIQKYLLYKLTLWTANHIYVKSYQMKMEENKLELT